MLITFKPFKAHQHSSGGNENLQSISKSVAGRVTKIHLAVDAHGNPLTFILSEGTTHERDRGFMC